MNENKGRGQTMKRKKKRKKCKEKCRKERKKNELYDINYYYQKI